MTRPETCGEHPCGSRQAYEAGCPLDGCRLMMVLHSKHSVVAPEVRESEVKRKAEPFAILLRALMREGYTLRQLSQRADYSPTALRNIALGVTLWIYPQTQHAIERLVASLPSESVSA